MSTALKCPKCGNDCEKLYGHEDGPNRSCRECVEAAHAANRAARDERGDG